VAIPQQFQPTLLFHDWLCFQNPDTAFVRLIPALDTGREVGYFVILFDLEYNDSVILAL